MSRTRHPLLLRLTLASAALAACLATAPATGHATTEGAPTAAAPATTPRATTPRATAPRAALTARTSAPLAVYASKGDETPQMTLPATTEFGTARVVLVTKRSRGWLRVLLPERPNGSAGWVRRRDVELRRVKDRITIDLAARTLVWHRAGEILLTAPIAIGAPDTPTPSGGFYVTDLLDTPDGGAYGPFAIGLSAHSDTLSEFGGGDGQIGVHGTADPSSIGNAVSHGCVRVPNDIVTQLATMLPLGTPVTIV